MKEKKPARKNVKFPGLKKHYNSKVKQEYMDADYVHILNDDEKQWLSDFMDEYYGAKLDFKNLENNRFHKTEKDKKACTDRNNARNRCVYGLAKAGGKRISIDDMDQDVDTFSEDDLIEILDEKKDSQPL